MIRRDKYLKKLNALKNTPEIKVITGVRRCGKTTLLKQHMEELTGNGISKENIIYISFESSKYRNIKDDKELDKVIFDKIKNLEGKIYLMFDEIQRVKNWQLAINSYGVDLNADIYITGSNSQLLSGELATFLSGRYIKMDIYPFSYNELLQYFKKNMETYTDEEVLNAYLTYGGLPGLYKYNADERIDYLKDMYNTILVGDIINKNNLKDMDLLERLNEFMIGNIGNAFSATSISKYLKNDNRTTTPKTIANYLNYSLKAYFLYKIKREDLKGKRILSTKEKYYLVDHGFYSLFYDEESRNLGRILENIVCIELLRRGYGVTVGKVYDLEVDFVCKKHDNRKYIQVSQTILDPNTRDREIRVLEKIKDNYPKYVITLDSYNLSHNGIKHVKLIDFLKDEDEF